MKIYIYHLCLFIIPLLFSCGTDEAIAPETSFNKIYNESSFSDFEAINIRQVEDDGFLVLATVDNSFSEKVGVPYLIRTDKKGNFLWDTQKDNTIQAFFNPIPNLVKKGNEYFFFCRRNSDKTINLLKISDANQSPSVVRTFEDLKGDIVYVSETPDKGILLMLLSETCVMGNKQPELIKIDQNFTTIQWRRCYPISVLVPINAITQKVNLNYFFNGVFTLGGQTHYFLTALNQANTSTILYTDANGNLLGKTETAFLINSLDQVVNNQFALTFIRRRDTNIVPSVLFDINSAEPPTIIGNTFHEINSEKRILTKRMTLNNKERVIFACTLENIPIRIYAFDPQTSTLQGTLTLGRVNPYEVVDIIQTNDGGMAIVTNTLVADRFIRIAILKISPQEVANLVN